MVKSVEVKDVKRQEENLTDFGSHCPEVGNGDAALEEAIADTQKR